MAVHRIGISEWSSVSSDNGKGSPFGFFLRSEPEPLRVTEESASEGERFAQFRLWIRHKNRWLADASRTICWLNTADISWELQPGFVFGGVEKLGSSAVGSHAETCARRRETGTLELAEWSAAQPHIRAFQSMRRSVMCMNASKLHGSDAPVSGAVS